MQDVGKLAELVDDPGSFARREAGRDERLGRHRLRGSELVLFVRHGTPDIGVLDEVFGQRQYDPPPPAATVLDALGRPPRIVDLGANVGFFALHARERWPGSTITSFEPDPTNLEVLERCHAANAGAGEWRLVLAAATTADGEVAFDAGHFACSSVVDAGAGGPAPDTGATTVTVPAVDALAHLAGADLAKIDVEGAEWALLGDPRLAGTPLRALVMEYHPQGCPGPVPRAAADALLRDAGFATRHTIERDDGVGLVWAWRQPA